MAQQNFARYLYTADDSENLAIRASTKVSGAQATAAAAAPAGSITVRTDRGSRGLGVRPRYLRLRRTAGTAPNLKVYYTRLPIFLAADVAAMKAQATFTLDGVAWQNSGYEPESKR